MGCTPMVVMPTLLFGSRIIVLEKLFLRFLTIFLYLLSTQWEMILKFVLEGYLVGQMTSQVSISNFFTVIRCRNVPVSSTVDRSSTCRS